MADTEKKTAKYRFLVDTIKEKIKNGEYEPGERMESENTLSEQFGYSRQTVRQALSVLEQEGLIERRRGSGTYISSESRRTPRGNSIAIVTTYISDYIFPTIIRGIEETLTNAGYDLTLNVTNNHVEEEGAHFAVAHLPPRGRSDCGGHEDGVPEPERGALPQA